MRLLSWLHRLLGRERHDGVGDGGYVRGAATHVVILDGTMSTLREGWETNVGLIYKLMREQGARAGLTLYYEPGLQWRDWRGTAGIMTGKGINRQIKRAYGVLASRYRPGDRIVLIGYSRGAYAVRSLAGVVDAVGLLRRTSATERNVRQAYRLYREGGAAAKAAFRSTHCHGDAAIEAVAVFDTVKALGFRVPLLWRLAGEPQPFHNHQLGPVVQHGFHALALDETRQAYAPVLWRCPPDWQGHAEQVWFRGTHADVGGQLGGFEPARPLSNIPLVWMLSRLEGCGIPLPPGWQQRFPQDVTAPSSGLWTGWGRIFLNRRRRVIGTDPSERLHETVHGVAAGEPGDGAWLSPP